MESIGTISDCGGVLISSLYSKAGTVALKVSYTSVRNGQGQMTKSCCATHWPLKNIWDKIPLQISHRWSAVQNRASHFLCPPRKSGVRWGDREIKIIIGPGSFQFFSFQKKTEWEKRTKKKEGGKERTNLCLLRGDPHLAIIVGALQQCKGDSDEDIYLKLFHGLCNICSKLMQARTHFC